MSKAWTDTLTLGKYTLKNRIALAAMTRIRCDPVNGIPNDLLVQYYSQRSGAGLLLTQCSSWSPRGRAYPGAGEIYTKDQAEGWRRVTTQVHKHGARIFLQIFHAGRATDASLNGGLEVWAPSAVGIKDEKIPGTGGNKDFPTPKQMTLQDIEHTKKEFEESVKLAKVAEFDGIQFHGANGYLIDQFLRSNTNKRTDHYGGSAEKRARFILELVDIALKHFQPYQIGVKFSPTGRYNDIFDQNPVETYSYVLQKLDERKIGFVELVESAEKEYGKAAEKYPAGKQQIQNVAKTLRPYFKGILYSNCVPTPDAGLQKIQHGESDGVSFARLFITNPDLPERIIHGHELNKNLDYKTFYGSFLEDKTKGYIDYPTFKEQQAA